MYEYYTETIETLLTKRETIALEIMALATDKQKEANYFVDSCVTAANRLIQKCRELDEKEELELLEKEKEENQ